MLTLLMIGGCACIFAVGSLDILGKFQQAGYDVTDQNILISFTPSFVFIATDIVISAIVYRLPKFEKYIRPQDEFYITVIRLFGIKTATVIVILLSLRAKIYQIFFDPIFYLLVYAISKFKRKKQFFMVPIVHDIIQVQALVWIGMLGYPLTPLYGMMYIAVSIYVYYWMLRVLSRPMERRWTESQRGVFFLALIGVMLLVVVFFILGISVKEDQYFYSIFSVGNQREIADIEEFGVHLSEYRVKMNMSELYYCGPIDPKYMLNPMNGLAEEFEHLPAFSKFLRIISSNACIVSILFVLAAFLYVLAVRINYEIERKEILLAERELERLEAKSKGRVRSK